MTFFNSGLFSNFLSWNLILNTSFDGQDLVGLGGNDQLTSTHNYTTLVGFGGNDQLTTALNYSPSYTRDIYAFQLGGTGNDVVTVNIDAYSNYIATALGGGRGIDQISVSTALSNTDTRFETAIENVILSDEGNDVVDVSSTLTNSTGVVNNVVYAGAGNDRVSLYADIVNGTGASTAYNYGEGGIGDDVMSGYVGGSASGDILGNELHGGGGADTLTGTVADGVEGGNYLYGGAGKDTLTVIGGNYNELYGENGNDTLIGSTTIDYMVGGSGADRFVFGLDSGDDIIADFVSGTDTLILTDGQTVSSVIAFDGYTTVLFGDASTVVLEGVELTNQAELFA